VDPEARAAEGDEVIRMLERDHQDINRLLGMFDGQAPDIAAELFWILADDLIRHEVAEEVVVYPQIWDASHPDGRVALGQQVAIEDRLTRLESMPTSGREFRHELAALRAAVSEHIEDEERDLFPQVFRALSQDRRRELGRRYAEVKETAPHHQFPGTTRNTIVGRVSALSDWIRDSASKNLWQAS
jgi:hypothetical protein